MTKLFGTDGIRGKANQYPITPEIALWTGKAIARYFMRNGNSTPRAVLGKDTRLSGYMLETALTSGLVSMGMDVFEIGPLPTPAVAHLTKSMCADCGIMITASHNPASDNGIKIFDKDGYKLPDEVEDQIEADILQMIRGENLEQSDKIGKAFRIDDARGRYIEFAKSSIRNNSLSGIRAVLDCANGAAYYIAPLILKELGVELIRTATSPDGSNINEKCGAMYPQNMQRLVREYKADIGISLDGDADRVIFSDHLGNIVNGDRIIGLCALDYKKRGRLSNDTVAVTCMSNMGLIESMKQADIKTEITQVGDRYVIDKMRELNLNLGGEQSGHLIFHDYATTGDGLISALHVARVMKRENKTLHDLASGFMTEFPQILKNIPVAEKVPLRELPEVQAKIEQARKSLGDSGKVMVRYSGTEKKCRVLVETRKKEDAEFWSKTICAEIEKALA